MYFLYKDSKVNTIQNNVTNTQISMMSEVILPISENQSSHFECGTRPSFSSANSCCEFLLLLVESHMGIEMDMANNCWQID
jgi:hypothetical protein